MNDATAQLLVDRLAAGLPEPTTAPIPELLRDGARSRRRRRRTTVGAVALAVGVIVAGVALVPRLGSDAPDPAPANEMPAPPPGMRWVGYGQEVVAVPESWTTGDAPCGIPQSNTIYLTLPGLSFFCATPVEPPGLSHVEMNPVASGATFIVESPDSDLVELIESSETVVPDGWTTVPWQFAVSPARYLDRLVERGFDVEVVEHYYQHDIGSARLSTVPAIGTPLRDRATIRVTVPTIEPDCGDDCALMDLRPDVAAAGDLVDLYFPQSTSRGIAFRLDRRVSGVGWQEEFFMTSSIDGRGTPDWARIGEAFAWPDIGIGGFGPDRILIPPAAGPGRYRICTANARQEICDSVTITE